MQRMISLPAGLWLAARKTLLRRIEHKLKAAKPTDFRTEPLPDRRTVIPMSRLFSQQETIRIRKGLVPQQMEDKWFIYWENDNLYFHRSWTGICIYVAHFATNTAGCKLKQVEVNRDPEQYNETSEELDARMISYLVDVLLLHRNVEFPVEKPSVEKQALANWSQVGRVMFGQHPNEESVAIRCTRTNTERPTDRTFILDRRGTMKLTKIDRDSLNARQKEIFNFQKISGLLADYGFNCIKLADDWQGADFLAYHKDGLDTLKVQLKSRLTIAQKYQGKDLYLAFPHQELWYLVEHDTLIEIVGRHTIWLNTDSWIKNGGYHSAAPSAQLMQSLAEYKL